MNEILNHLEPWEVVVVTAIVAGAWVLLGLGSAWRQVREKQARASLVQELLSQGRPVEEVERLLWATSDLSQPPPTDEQALVSLAEALTQMGVSGAAIGEIMAATRAADSATKHAVSRSVSAMVEHEPKEEQIIAVVRGLCVAVPPAALADALSQPFAERRVSC